MDPLDPLDPHSAAALHKKCTLRQYSSLSIWNDFHMKALVLSVFLDDHREWINRNFPFLVRFDYEVVPGFSQYGRGDAVFADPLRKRLLVLQAQYLDYDSSGSTSKNRRTKKRQKVKEQALEYAEKMWQKWHPSGGLFCTAVTNETSPPRAGCLAISFYRMSCPTMLGRTEKIVESKGEGVHHEFTGSTGEEACEAECAFVFVEVPLSAADLSEEDLAGELSSLSLVAEETESREAEVTVASLPILEYALVVDAKTCIPERISLPLDASAEKKCAHDSLLSKELLEHLDSIHRPYMHLRGHELGDQEALLGSEFVEEEYVKKDWPYVFAYEWPVAPGRTQWGKGDVILCDGEKFLILEIKYINLDSHGATASTARTKRRKKVREQAARYCAQFCLDHPGVPAVAASLMNDINRFEWTSIDTVLETCLELEPTHSSYEFVLSKSSTSSSCEVRASSKPLPHILPAKMLKGEQWVEFDLNVDETFEATSAESFVVADEESLAKRDTVIRQYLAHVASSGDEKASVALAFTNSDDVLRKWPFIYQYEWEFIPGHSNDGKGDIVLTNGNMFLAVETQYLTSRSGSTMCTKRTQKRKEIRERLHRVWEPFCQSHPERPVAILSVLNSPDGSLKWDTYPLRRSHPVVRPFASLFLSSSSSSESEGDDDGKDLFNAYAR
eukprot:TRINITY_DN2668_c1_g3_i1.p1 TRINITY_DN2668_c1_g3~~TRINITY_DN2668_c1_g3_i1.p1  ORF type:complete len:672 (+),score=181.94 TRINITY_DN2668_c1_g3_i1:362-2377(+)